MTLIWAERILCIRIERTKMRSRVFIIWPKNFQKNIQIYKIEGGGINKILKKRARLEPILC